MKATGRNAATIGSGGFTLVEVMVALVVLVLGALSLTQLSLSVAVMMQRTSARTELIAAAENRLESMQATPFTDLVPGVLVDTVAVRGAPYLRRVTITAPGARLRRIEVDLRGASSRGGLAHSALTYVSSP